MQRFSVAAGVTLACLAIAAPTSADLSWHLRNSNSTGPTDVWFHFGVNTDVPVAGDWNFDQVDTPGIFRNGAWHMRNWNSSGPASETSNLGQAGDKPVPGGWGAWARDVPGVFRSGWWYVRNVLGGVTSFAYGNPSDRPLVHGQERPVVVRAIGTVLRWYPQEDPARPLPVIDYGNISHVAVIGDWNGDGADTPGVYIPSTGQWHLNNHWLVGDPADVVFTYGGAAGDQPIVGDWNGDGIDTVGVVRQN